MAFNLLLRSHRAYVLVGSLVLAFASLWPNVAVAQQLSPGCYQDIPSQPGFYVEPGKNYKVRIFQAPGDPVGQNPFWTSDYVNNVVQGLQAWSNANSASGLGVSYGTVSSGEDLRIQVWQGARQSIPGQDCQNGLCDSSIVRTSTGTTIYIQQDLSPFDFLKMVLHEVGHYQGLGDVYDPTANGRTVMADNVLISQRLAYVTACDLNRTGIVGGQLV